MQMSTFACLLERYSFCEKISESSFSFWLRASGEYCYLFPADHPHRIRQLGY